MKKIFQILLCAGVLTPLANVAIAQFNDSLKIDYFGQMPPGITAIEFAPDFISRKGWYVQNGCFSQDGKDFVFGKTDSAWTSFSVMYTRNTGDTWTEPMNIFPGEKALGMPFFSDDNTCLYFSKSLIDVHTSGDIYVSRRIGDGWQKPEKVGYPVSADDGDEWEVCEARNGT